MRSKSVLQIFIGDYSPILEDLLEFQVNYSIPKGPQYTPVVLRSSVLPGTGCIPISLYDFTLQLKRSIWLLSTTPSKATRFHGPAENSPIQLRMLVTIFSVCIFPLITFCFLSPFFLYYHHYQLCYSLKFCFSSMLNISWVRCETASLAGVAVVVFSEVIALMWIRSQHFPTPILCVPLFHWHLLLLSFPAFFSHADHCSFQTPFWLEPQTRWSLSAVLLQTLFSPVWMI